MTSRPLCAMTSPIFFRFHTIEDASVCGTASRRAAEIVYKLRVHAAGNVVELFVLTLVFLQTTPIRDSGLETGLHVTRQTCE
ncbi:hypothetical protein TNCV_3654331 [Trichonephila clavipes]|nr:hypothetical protein TNCV_3654331 [Trichonephila clavipes]